MGLSRAGKKIFANFFIFFSEGPNETGGQTALHGDKLFVDNKLWLRLCMVRGCNSAVFSRFGRGAFQSCRRCPQCGPDESGGQLCKNGDQKERQGDGESNNHAAGRIRGGQNLVGAAATPTAAAEGRAFDSEPGGGQARFCLAKLPAAASRRQ